MKAKYIFPILAFSLGMTSCVDDLDVSPIDPNSNTTIDPVALFNKCYATMAVAGNSGPDGDSDVDGIDGGTSGFVRQYFNSNVLTTDEGICCWGDDGIPTFNMNKWNASHPMLRGYYYRLYFGITLYNFYLSECGDVDPIRTAEVRFLRALHYYLLLDGYGNVPFCTEIKSAAAEQMQRADLFNFVESELLECEKLLSDAAPKKLSDKNSYGRVDKASAWMLLSRLYLNAEVYTGTAQWQKARDYAEKVMKSPYKLNTTGLNGWSAYQMLFMGDNASTSAADEIIMPIICDGIDSRSWGSSLYFIASTFKGDEVVKEGTVCNGTSAVWAGNRARRDLVDKFFPAGDAPEEATTAQFLAAANDDRALFWSKNRTLDVENPNDFNSGTTVVKFTNHYAGGGTAKDVQFPDMSFPMLRVAEAYLNFAEADARINGGQASVAGIDAFNALRSRANAATYPSVSLDVICDEWSREFFFEGYRRPVLIRFNRFGGNVNYNWQWKGGDFSGINFGANMNIFAIPETDMNVNKNLTQNPGY